MLVKDNLVPFNEAYCNFILNVSPNDEFSSPPAISESGIYNERR